MGEIDIPEPYRPYDNKKYKKKHVKKFPISKSNHIKYPVNNPIILHHHRFLHAALNKVLELSFTYEFEFFE